MTEKQLRAQLNDVQALALTLWAEARGEPIEGIVGVGWVIKNRLAHHARYRATERSYKGVVLAPQQFSCWNAGTDANHVRLMSQAERVLTGAHMSEAPWLECAWAAVGIFEGRLRDRTRGATHYLTSDLYRDVSARHWARRLRFLAALGSHVFLIEPDAGPSRGPVLNA